MRKKVTLVVGVIMTIFGFYQFGNTQSVQAQAANLPTYFCHRSNSASNPYVNVPFSTGYSEIDGVGQNDHSKHTGPVVTTQAQAGALKKVKVDWGDIIPPVPGVLENGLNWTAAGQAVYYADCNFSEYEDEYNPAQMYFNVACSEDNKSVVVTVVNIGGETGSVSINDEYIEVEPGETVTRSYELGGKITVFVGEDGDPSYDQVPVCETETPVTPVAPVTPGRGSGSVAIAAIPVALLPSTAGVNYAVFAGVLSAAALAISLATKKLYTKFF